MSAPLVRDYRSLRQGLSRRDRSLREKVMSLHDAATPCAGRNVCRHWRLNDVPHADGDDLGVDASAAKAAHLFAQHRFDRRRPLVRLRHRRRSHHQLVRARHSLGSVQGHAPPCREGRQAVPGMEPYGDGHALSRRRHGRAVPADPLDARLRRSQAASGSEGDSTARSPARSCCSCPRSTRTSR